MKSGAKWRSVTPRLTVIITQHDLHSPPEIVYITSFTAKNLSVAARRVSDAF